MVSIGHSGGEQPLSSVSSAHTVPFFHKSYKEARVYGMFLAGGVSALSLRVVSAACRIFSEALADTYFSMAQTEFARGRNAPVTYFGFTDALIDFSYNGCVLPPPSDTELNALRAHYGTKIIDDWLHIGTEKMPLIRERLTRREKKMCFGASLDFIKQYLAQTRLGIPPMASVLRNCSRYVMGAPKEAQVTHIFYSALDRTRFRKEEDNWMSFISNQRATEECKWTVMQCHWLLKECPTMCDPIWQKIAALKARVNERAWIFRNEILSNELSVVARNSFRYMIGAPKKAEVVLPRLKKEEDNRIIFLSTQRTKEECKWTVRQCDHLLEECPTMSCDPIWQKMAVLEAQIDERASILRKEIIYNRISVVARARQHCHTIIGNQLGLQIDFVRAYVLDEMLPDFHPGFSHSLEELSDGCYLVGFDLNSRGHAISLVKTNREYFLYDSNCGTLVFETNAIAENLCDLWRSFCVENGVSTLSFFLCSPVDELPHGQVL